MDVLAACPKQTHTVTIVRFTAPQFKVAAGLYLIT